MLFGCCCWVSRPESTTTKELQMICSIELAAALLKFPRARVKVKVKLLDITGPCDARVSSIAGTTTTTRRKRGPGERSFVWWLVGWWHESEATGSSSSGGGCGYVSSNTNLMIKENLEYLPTYLKNFTSIPLTWASVCQCENFLTFDHRVSCGCGFVVGWWCLSWVKHFAPNDFLLTLPDSQ